MVCSIGIFMRYLLCLREFTLILISMLFLITIFLSDDSRKIMFFSVYIYCFFFSIRIQ